MKKLLPCIGLVLLAACVSSRATSSNPLDNPLVAERYWSEMAEHMADYIRNNDLLVKDPLTGAVVDGERLRALKRVEEVRSAMKGGMRGQFLNIQEDVKGGAMLLENAVYFSTDFLAYPDPSPQVYLTTVVDPRDTHFPDATAVHLGQLKTPYGAQDYAVPEGSADPRLKTVVLYDTRLKTILSFAQLVR